MTIKIEMRIVLAAFLCGLFCLVIDPAVGRADWIDVPCARSEVFVADSVRCRTSANAKTGNPDVNSGSLTNFLTFGAHQGSRFALVLQTVKPPAFFHTYTTAAASEAIRRLVVEAVKPKSLAWGTSVADAALTAISFNADGSNCIGFDYAGPPDPSTPHGNHSWLLRGYICPAQEYGAVKETITALLAAIRIGPPERRRNVFGSALEVWPAGSGQAVPRPAAPPVQDLPNPRAATPHSVPTETTGTGFFITSSGHVLTNNHVVASCRGITIRRSDGLEAPAQLATPNPNDDLALLLSSMRPAAVATFRSGRSVRQGNRIVVFGFPLAGALSSAGNLTTGDVTALAGLRDDMRIYQISAPIQPGNSGGPVLDTAGNVVGVIMSKLDAVRVANLTGDVPQNVNFAIKSSVAINFLDAAGIDYRQTPSTRDIGVEAVGDRARRFTVRVICRR